MALFLNGASIQHIKEMGRWSEEDELHNQVLVQRQGVLQAAWRDYVESTSVTGDAFVQGWLAARIEALESADMDPIWR